MKRINLALQGGGAHGAFTWGVLDRLLEDPRIQIDAISGTSAGAMNAVAVADGIMKGGNQGARDALEKFWRKVSHAAFASPFRRTPMDRLTGNWSLDFSPPYLAADLLGRIASPYVLNPLNVNPLLDLLNDQIDFETVRSCDKVKVFVSATNVETGRIKVFNRKELTADMVMASACLPFVYQAVEIDGVPYWDGGYAGNPVLFPFFKNSQADDIVVVQINPVLRKGTPRGARDILNRVNEITFNNSLLKEFRAIDFVYRLIDDGKLGKEHYRQMHLHVIGADEELKPLGASSKLNAEWEFLRHLFSIGRETCEQWISKNYDDIGRQSTFNAREMFAG
ncbi:MAG: patatin-like phospholipase family protein [Methyloceanibacter sp.]|nr:patatin-like phospholipase family protein [Methyloceanibacter sp.]